MNKVELAKSVAEKCGMSQKDVNSVLDAFGATVVEEVLVKGDKITMPGVGSFKQLSRDARIARNPSNGEAVRVPAKKVLTFKMSKTV